MPLDETFPLEATNPYGRTKLFNEHILIDYQKAHPSFNATLLRYFNPIGAHESGLLDEGLTHYPLAIQLQQGMPTEENAEILNNFIGSAKNKKILREQIDEIYYKHSENAIQNILKDAIIA